MALLTETTTQEGDLLTAFWDHRHNFEQCVIKNPQAVAYADQQLFGIPVKNITRVDKDHYSADLVLAGDEASVEGLVLKEDVVSLAATGGADTTTKRYKTLVRGPAVVNQDQIRLLDPAGAAYNIANIALALIALGITCRAEPSKAMTWG
jgi:hypothetical protein